MITGAAVAAYTSTIPYRFGADRPAFVIARSSADAPEIDGLVFVDDFFEAEPGDFLQVRVVDADEHDLYAEVVQPS